MSKLFSNQTFWLGAMSALAVIFFFLFVGNVTGKVAFNFGSSKGYAAPAAAPTAAAPVADAGTGEIVIEPLSDDDWVRGDLDAKVTIVEFSDIDCPFCQRFHDSMNEVLAEYDGQINWVYRDFPLDGLHPEARTKAVAAECVGQLGGNEAYWTYLDALFASSAADEVTAEATKLGIDPAAFTACQADPAILAEVADDEAQGSAAGARGTPYSVIIAGDKKVAVNGAVPTAQLKTFIDGALTE